MHNPIRPIKPINRHIKTQNKNPPITRPTARIDELRKDKPGTRLGRHGEENNGPGKPAHDIKRCTEHLQSWLISGAGKHAYQEWEE